MTNTKLTEVTFDVKVWGTGTMTDDDWEWVRYIGRDLAEIFHLDGRFIPARIEYVYGEGHTYVVPRCACGVALSPDSVRAGGRCAMCRRRPWPGI